MLLDAGSYAAEVLAEDVCLLGQIALTKYSWVRHAVNLLIVGAAVLALALVLAALA